MQVQKATGVNKPIPGSVNTLLRDYASERGSFVAATEKAKRFLSGRSYDQTINVVDRDSKEAANIVQALTKNQLSHVRYELQKGFDANALLTNAHNKEHASMVTLAQSALAVRLLLDAGANPNARPDVIMPNPLTTVIKGMPEADRIEAVDVLLQAGADPNGGTGLGAGPLDAAVARPDIGVVMLLIDAGAQVDKFAVLSTIQTHNERAMRVSKDPWQLQMNVEKTRKVVDLLVYASDESHLREILADKEVSRLLKLTPEIDELFKERVSPESTSKPSSSAMNLN